MLRQVNDHAVGKLRDVPPFLQSLGQKHTTDNPR